MQKLSSRLLRVPYIREQRLLFQPAKRHALQAWGQYTAAEALRRPALLGRAGQDSARLQINCLLLEARLTVTGCEVAAKYQLSNLFILL